MKYRIRYDSRCRNDTLDWAERIDAGSDRSARLKAMELIDGLNKKAQKEDSRTTYILTGIDRVTKKKVMVVQEEFTPI